MTNVFLSGSANNRYKAWYVRYATNILIRDPESDAGDEGRSNAVMLRHRAPFFRK